jgi:hypothetical protein
MSHKPEEKAEVETDGNSLYLGTRDTWDGPQVFTLDELDLRQHLFCIGKTGTGKSTLLRNLILQLILKGRGVGVIDPHGDLAEDLLEHYPPHRSDHLVYFDPADQDHPIGLNLLRCGDRDRRHLVASGIVGSMKSLYRDSWGPRLEYLLYSAVAALSECQNVSLLGLHRMLVEERYRRWVVDQVKDPMVRSFWLREFASYDRRFLAEMLSPALNKIGQLVMSPPIRNVLGQVRSKIDLRVMMDMGRVLLANLSKGKLGADKANLLGSLLVSQFQLAAMARSDVRESDRRQFVLFLDEFQNFTTDSFVAMLAEARKYGLCLVLVSQHLSAVAPEVRDAVLGNVGTIVSFRLSDADAQIMSREFGGDYVPAQFTQLANHQVLVRPLYAERATAPFRAETLPPLPLRRGRPDKLVLRSREKYGVHRLVVEEKIRRWLRS